MTDEKNIKFFHKVQLKKNINKNMYKYVHTNGMVDVQSLRKIYLFDSVPFNNKSVLDVGCWDGYFSFESELKGASEVVSLDNPDFRWGGMDGYNFLRNYYNSKAKFVCGSVYNLKEIFPNKKFDIVLCYGVLYHLSDPLRALINLFEITNEYLILEGIFHESEEKKLELIDCGYYGGDTSNMYNMSSGYVNYVSELYGFKVETIQYHMDYRGSILLKKEKEFKDKYTILSK